MFKDDKITYTFEVEISPNEAFDMLCKALHMNYVLDENTDYFVKKSDYFDYDCVYYINNASGKEVLYDERGELFVALRNVAVNMYPNLSFRNAEYIYN